MKTPNKRILHKNMGRVGTTMLKFERIKAIKDILKKRGSVSISELSKLFNVTEETVINDLAEL